MYNNSNMIKNSFYKYIFDFDLQIGFIAFYAKSAFKMTKVKI